MLERRANIGNQKNNSASNENRVARISQQMNPLMRAINNIEAAKRASRSSELRKQQLLHVWTWGGKYFGYIDGATLWTYKGKHIANLENTELYDRNGTYLGEILNENRLITCKAKKHLRKHGFTPYMNRMGTLPFVGYVGYVMYVGYEDFPGPGEFHK